MSSFYLDRKDSELSLEGGTLVIRCRDYRHTIPVILLKRLIIVAKTRLDTGLLNRLTEKGVAVLMLDPHRSQRRALVLGGSYHDATVRMAQYRASIDCTWSLAWAKALVGAKLKRHRRWLLKMATQRQDLNRRLKEAIHELQHLIDESVRASTLAQLRGWEGQGGKVFFTLYRHLFPAGLGFESRRRRPPPDPVNAVLSLSYVLLHVRAVQISWAMGLDPMIGFYHQPYWGRESLACDLIEPWRPCIDAWVYQWFHERWLAAGHFSKKGPVCRLGKAGRQRFFSAFESRMIPIHRAIRVQAGSLIKEIQSCPRPSI